MADLPSINSREVLTSLKSQEALLENISRVLVKRENYTSRTEKPTDNKIIDRRNDTSLIKKLLSAFRGDEKVKLTSHEIQHKTLEEIKTTKGILQRTGLDIEFIRKSYEDSKKKKDRELLADTLRSAIGGNDGRSGLAGILGGIGTGILAGIKGITATVGGLVSSLLGVFSIAGLTAIFKGALLASGLAMLLKSSDTASDDYENKETYRDLKNAGPGSDIFENNVKEMARNEHFSQYLSKNPLQKEEYDKKSFDEQKEMKNKYFDELFELASYSQELGEELTDYYNAFDRANIQELAAYNKKMAKIPESVRETVDKMKDVDTSPMDQVVKEGEEAMKKASDTVSKLAGIIGATDLFKSMEESFASIGKIKFKDGEMSIFDATGGFLMDMYEGATKELMSLKDKQQTDGTGAVNTQVNNTNVVGGGDNPVYFPNANSQDKNPSIVRFLYNESFVRF